MFPAGLGLPPAIGAAAPLGLAGVAPPAGEVDAAVV